MRRKGSQIPDADAFVVAGRNEEIRGEGKRADGGGVGCRGG